ncbi:dockerin type I domain-containing protein [uncultured Ruminococcus sp.]|uniref:dockerin type I domain-containing protein n=1 Tax=uncultured Ruminococcus sp. TaxID=165186 RepID=UPI00260FAE82|nr:dockerin type I domain-containing protein [uncultured Ruminococcus sp.]
MLIKKTISALISTLLLSGAVAAASAAADTTKEDAAADKDPSDNISTTAEPKKEPTTLKKYNITFLDFDGNVMTSFNIEEGDPINYSDVNTKSLHKHLDEYTEQDFSSWDIKPDFADADYTIHALSKTASITHIKPPAKHRYYTLDGEVSLAGFEASIKMTVQTPEKDEKGNYKTEESIVDVSESCTAKPSSLKEAFAKGDKATITVYPLGDQKSLCSFEIIYHRGLGDVNSDGSINSTDASQVLATYANMAASKDYTVSDKMLTLSDVNMDGKLDARDASHILRYYAVASTSQKTVDWDDFFDYDEILGIK